MNRAFKEKRAWICLFIVVVFVPVIFGACIHSAYAADPIRTIVDLYFADTNQKFLTTEKRVLSHMPGIQPLSGAIINALVQGSQNDFITVVPKNTKVRGVYLIKDGTAVIDFSNEIYLNHPKGIKAEILTVYAIVNSLVLNIPEIKKVKFLINGNERATLAGHFDIRFPIKAQMLIVR